MPAIAMPSRRGNATALDMRRQLIQLGKVAEQLHATWSDEGLGPEDDPEPEACGMRFIKNGLKTTEIIEIHMQ